MYQYGSLFALQLAFQHYEEFKENFYLAFDIYFKSISNKQELKELLSKYFLEFKFSKKEMEMAINIQESRILEIDKEKNQMDWQMYDSNKKLKARN